MVCQGNDDCGTMSAWVAFSMMGLYPTCPGDVDFAITTPVFDKITIELDNRFYQGETFEIIKKGKNQKITGIELNSKPHNSYFVKHQDIVKGGRLVVGQ